MADMSSKRKRARTKEASHYCGSSSSTFNKLRVTGGGPPFYKVGRIVVYDYDDLDAWLESKMQLSTSHKPHTSKAPAVSTREAV